MITVTAICLLIYQAGNYESIFPDKRIYIQNLCQSGLNLKESLLKTVQVSQRKGKMKVFPFLFRIIQESLLASDQQRRGVLANDQQTRKFLYACSFYVFYSDRKLFTGFIIAALIACQLMVSKVSTIEPTAAYTNTQTEIYIRYGYFSSH
jgi:hypothetical protein